MKRIIYCLALTGSLFLSPSVFGQLHANFTVDHGTGCSPVVAHFTDASTGIPVRWHWIFDNIAAGDTSDLQNPLWIYTSPGHYNVKLIVYNAYGTSDTMLANNEIFVASPPVVRFTTPDTILECAPHTVNFTNSSDTGGCTPSYTWYIDTSSSIHTTNATYTFTHSGNYDITLRETDACGCSGYLTKSAYIKIDSTPTANFTTTNTTPCSAPATVCFTNHSTGATHYQWHFGDGGRDSVLNPCHTYTASGNYTDSLTSYNANGCNASLVRTSYIQVGHFIPGFYTASSSVCANTSTSFTDTTSGATGHRWHFSLAATDTSSVAGPSHTFTAAGTYTVKDSVWNTTGCSGVVTHTITVNAAPVVSFTGTNIYRCTPNDTVTYTSTVTDASGIATRRWRFGDVASGIYNSANTDSVHIYTTPGSFSPEITVTDNNGCVTKDSVTNYIKVQAPTVTLSVTLDSGCIPFLLHYSTSISPSVTYITDSVTFGDGSSATVASGIHTYSVAGRYTVHHYYHLPTGCYYSDSIKVSAGSHATYSPVVSPAAGCPNTNVHFTGNCTNCTYEVWNTTLATSAKDTTSARYTTSGTKIAFFIADNTGCVDTTKDTVLIYSSTASFTAAVSSCTNRLSYNFTNNSVGATGYRWSFGDGDSSSAVSPTHVYTSYGTYSITLTDNDTGGHGCMNYFTSNITITSPPTTFSVNDTFACKQQILTFTGPLTPAGLKFSQYTWKFGDGISLTSTTANTATHSYNNTGTYSDTLIVKSANGCYDTLAKHNYVGITAPAGGVSTTSLTGCAPLTVNFHDADTAYTGGYIKGRHWTWSTGSAAVKAYGTDTSHTYPEGIYTAVLVDSDNIGCTVADTIHITSSKVHAYFTSPDTLMCKGLPAHLTDSNTHVSYNWYFGDGSAPALSATQTTAHTYSANGSYSDTAIVVTIAGGSLPVGCADTMVRTNYIHISSSLLAAGFNLNDTFANCPPLIGLATNTTAPATGISYRWKLGLDSTTITSTTANQLYVYNYPGHYTITMIATNAQGCEDSAKKSVSILGPTGTLSVSTDSGCTPFPVTLTLTSTGTSVLDSAYTWSVPPYGVFNTTLPTLTESYADSGSWDPYVVIKSSGCNVIVHTDDTIRAMSPNVTVNHPATICRYGTASLLAQGAYTYSWSPATGLSCTTCANPIASPTATTTYTVTGTTRYGCSDTVTTTVYVDAPPAIIIAGHDSICTGSCDTLTASGITAPYTWSPASTSCTTCTTFIVCPTADQTYTISGTDANGCGDSTSFAVHLRALPVVSVTPDSSAICFGTSSQLSASGASSYSWAPDTLLSCSHCAAPFVNAQLPQTYTVTGTNAAGCSATATAHVTIKAQPVAGTVSGTDSICAGSTTVFSDTAAGGVWSSSNSGIATISSTGSVTGISNGITTISYTVTNSCGTAIASKNLFVNPLPIAGPISGITTVCAGSSITLTDSSAGGTWTSANTAAATISGSGLLTGIDSGTTVISYTLSNSCGTATTTATVTVNTVPFVSPITGDTILCAGTSSTLSNSAGGGIWTSSNTSVSSISTSGIVNASSQGITTISYNITNVCGTSAAATTVTVNPLPVAGIIAGDSTVCAGSTTSLTDSTSGGTWTSATSSVATINNSGIVTAVSAGTTTISYVRANSCGTVIVTKVITVNALPVAGTITGTASTCQGDTLTLTDLATGGTWSSSNSSIASVSSIGSVTAMAAGSAIISYTAITSCGTATATKSITVNPLPVAGTINGTTTLCAGSSTTLTDTSTGGVWRSSNVAIATVNSAGLVTGVTAGAVTISYAVTNGCGIARAVHAIVVNPLPVAGVISGVTSACAGTSMILSDTTSAGTWSSSNTALATISDSGLVYTIAAGTINISYLVTNSCGTATATKTITINPLPFSGNITGSTIVCAGSATHLADTVSGGVWSSANTAVASVNTAGWVTGIAAGSSTISYVVANSCGTATAIQSVIVSPLPVAGVISGLSSACAGSTLSLSDTASGGIWNSSNIATATVSDSGTVTAIAAGTTHMSYTVTNSCGTAVATKTITVNPLPIAGTITGTTTLCAGATSHLSDTATVGIWSSSNAAIASVSATGLVTGIAAGAATISYVVTNSCGTATATQSLMINPLPVAGIVSGTTSACVGTIISLSDTASGGTWSSSNMGTASISASGAVTAIAAGTTTISYTVINSCGTAVAAKTITVNPLPFAASISGSTTICAGSATSLTDVTAGGTWSSTNPSIASVSSTGVVSALTAGASAIYYTYTNVCGTAVSTVSVTINPLPHAGMITGDSIICQSLSISFSDTAIGGTWSTAGTIIATINSSGILTVIAPGTTEVLYTATNSCGTVSATRSVTVNPLPVAGSITGTTIVCAGSNVTLSDTASGGVWTSTNTDVASVVSPGHIHGIATGTTTISYTVTNSCGTAVATTILTVNPLPVAGAVTGASGLCAGTTTILSDSASGGVWTSAASGTATVDSFGNVSGVHAGSTNIIYSVTNSCGTATATKSIVVNPQPVSGTISGSLAACAGTSLPLTDSSTGGTWSSADPVVASVSSTGNVRALLAGSAVISYTVINGCGTAVATHLVTVNPLPVAAAITGTASICTGENTMLSDSAAGGIWSSAATAIAAVGSTGIMTGISAGTTTVSYTVTNSCGTAVATYSVTIRPQPFAGTITGEGTICSGSTIVLAETVSGGVWSVADTTVLSVNELGKVTGGHAGNGIVNYAVTNSCGTIVTTAAVTVIDTLPNPGAITGNTTVCVGSVTTLSDAVAGGAWSSASTIIAAIGEAGIVSGISAGSTAISYTLSNSCGSASATAVVNVNPLPQAGVINGLAAICVGAGEILTDTSAGGIWSSLYTNLATITVDGSVSGLIRGIDTLFYTVTNSCGTAVASFALAVDQAPDMRITTHPVAGLCDNVLYQNFGTNLPEATGVEYAWSTNNATLYATGAGNQYCLVSFSTAGTATVRLTTSVIGAGCAFTDSFVTSVGNTEAAVPQVIFYSPNELVCLDNTADSYQWGYDDRISLDSTLITGAQNMDYFIADPDFTNKNYWVMTSHNGCLQKTYYNLPLAVAQTSTSAVQLSLFPNPATDEITIQVKGVSSDVEYNMFDMAGKVVYKGMITGGSTSVEVSQLASAVYMVMVTDNGTMLGSQAFVKR